MVPNSAVARHRPSVLSSPSCDNRSTVGTKRRRETFLGRGATLSRRVTKGRCRFRRCVAKRDKGGVRVVLGCQRAGYRRPCDPTDLAFQVDDQPLGGFFFHARRARERRRVACRGRRRDIWWACYGKDREARTGAGTRGADEHLVQRATHALL